MKTPDLAEFEKLFREAFDAFCKSLEDGSFWNSEHVEEHRRGISDLEWAKQQQQGASNYYVGDIVRFLAGGFGVVTEVSETRDGWPPSYATKKIPGAPFHPRSKCAWHYEGDLALEEASPLRNWKPCSS